MKGFIDDEHELGTVFAGSGLQGARAGDEQHLGKSIHFQVIFFLLLDVV